MIVFFAKDAEEVVLASIIKHYNPSATMRMYEQNEDLISLAKIHNEPNFLRIKDYKTAIINRYNFPEWIKNDSKIRFIELVIAHKNTNIYSLVKHLAEYLFSPEKLFYSSLDRTVMFKDNAMQVMRELGVFKKFKNSWKKNGIHYYEINPEHDILELYSSTLLKKCSEPFAVLCKNKAIVMNAKKAGFIEDKALISRYDALNIKKEVLVNPAVKKSIKPTIATKIIEF
ncbi:MAG: hypothetical protein PHT91_03420 [Candidatus Nanoarchaeia archaeon]|nr:hypothetical protein [Candidatus Nanoarchaeia archaeon]MDD5053909.1 hypothetical protein [Candidatus Nanoarchaeia archaeon]MDD5499898.1 hypothetical protein [Candidatus Nanoarchaeia archaeon]